MPTWVELERNKAEARFQPSLRSLDWEELWLAYASILGDDRPVMAYVRDDKTQRISPMCRNLAR